DSIFPRKVRYDVGRATEYQPYKIMHSIFTILLMSITNSTSIGYMILLMTILTRKRNLFISSIHGSFTLLTSIIYQSTLLVLLKVVIWGLILAMNLVVYLQVFYIYFKTTSSR